MPGVAGVVARTVVAGTVGVGAVDWAPGRAAVV